MSYPLEDDICYVSEPLIPVAPLLDAFTRAGYDTLGKISRTTGIAPSVLSITRKRGTINAYIADHLIVRHLDQHPVNVYGDSWLDRTHYRAGRIDVLFEELTGVAS